MTGGKRKKRISKESSTSVRATVHTHPIELIAMSHNKKFMGKDVLSNLLWSMIPETKAFCPLGLGIVPSQLPGSLKLAEETLKELEDYDVVMWEKHGVFAKGFKNAVVSLSDECCDVIVGKDDVTDEKRAQIEDITEYYR